MGNFTFIALFAICMLFIVNGEVFPGDLVISDSMVHNYNGLRVGGNLLNSGSGVVRVIGNADVAGNLDHAGSGVFHTTGVLTVRGVITKPGSGVFKADGGIVN